MAHDETPQPRVLHWAGQFGVVLALVATSGWAVFAVSAAAVGYLGLAVVAWAVALFLAAMTGCYLAGWGSFRAE